MGEIDTKPIESVQSAISFFGEKTTNHKRNSPVHDELQEVEKERELETLMKDIANIKLQLEAKDFAYKQALLKLDHHKKTSDHLLTLLKNSDTKKEFYINESRVSNARINELESANKLMADQLLESEKVQEQLLHATSDLTSARGQMLEMEKEIDNLREAKVEATSEAEAMRSAFGEEKLKTEELMSRISEMNEKNNNLKMEILEIERGNIDAVLEKEAELEKASKALFEAQEQLEWTRKQLETIQLELKQANELHMSELNQLKEETKAKEKNNIDQVAYISLLESELEKSRLELETAKTETSGLNEQNENMKSELEKSKENENDAQVEIALLKFELHKGKSKLAGAEAVELRLQSEKSALYNALQQMGLEAEEAKKENKILEEAIKLADDIKNDSQENEADENYEPNREYDAESLKMNKVHENDDELENMKKELEIAMKKIGELRTRAEQAISRAKAAERAKSTFEEKMKRRKEQKEKRKATFSALLQESVPKKFSPNNNSIIRYDDEFSRNYQPLGKVLNMKF